MSLAVPCAHRWPLPATPCPSQVTVFCRDCGERRDFLTQWQTSDAAAFITGDEPVAAARRADHVKQNGRKQRGGW